MRAWLISMLYLAAMVAAVAGVDVLFLKHDLVLRLVVNVAMVAVLGGIYLKFVRRP